MRDAAEALDYLAQQYSLQHLDIKPENLLLVGGRVKVADFGQVKDLQNVKESMISGLTPVYAAPELFDGAPGFRSDQYSLAIVYQEMLTGALPFGGRSAAQLAAQHLHGRPQIESLPASDQPAIARALSKNPEQRFRACCDMVAALFEVTPNRSCLPASGGPAAAFCGDSPPPAAHARGDLASPADGATQRIEEFVVAAAAGDRSQSPATIELSETVGVRDESPLEIAESEFACRPTVFVGIGGLAAAALRQMNRRLQDGFGEAAGLPAVQLLLLDTDSHTLEWATEKDAPGTLPNHAAVFLPLRQTADYRASRATSCNG